MKCNNILSYWYVFFLNFLLQTSSLLPLFRQLVFFQFHIVHIEIPYFSLQTRNLKNLKTYNLRFNRNYLSTYTRCAHSKLVGLVHTSSISEAGLRWKRLRHLPSVDTFVRIRNVTVLFYHFFASCELRRRPLLGHRWSHLEPQLVLPLHT